MQQGGGSETEVTWEDQQNINKFGRLNNRFHELEDEIKTAKLEKEMDFERAIYNGVKWATLHLRPSDNMPSGPHISQTSNN